MSHGLEPGDAAHLLAVVHQVAAELQALDISSTAIKAIFEVIQLSDVADLSSLLGQDSKVRSSMSQTLHCHP